MEYRICDITGCKNKATNVISYYNNLWTGQKRTDLCKKHNKDVAMFLRNLR